GTCGSLRPTGGLGGEARPPGEQLAQPPGAMLEDPPDIPPHEKTIHERTPEDGIPDPVADLGPAVSLRELVLVDPHAVGAADLLIHEASRRVPGGDLGA